MRSSSPLAALLLLFGTSPRDVIAEDNDTTFSPCPLIGAYYPPPTIDKTADAFVKLQSSLAKTFDELIENGGSDKYGPISPNTTSFSVALFGGAQSLRDDPIFFEYHYTSPHDQRETKTNVTSTTKFPVGDVSMVFTVYAWLVEMGEAWDTPITKFLPALLHVKGESSSPWEDVSVGSLAGHLSGLSRQSGACDLDKECDWKDFVGAFALKTPVFLPDTTPVVSYAAYQLLVFAMQNSDGHKSSSWEDILKRSVLEPLNMTSSGLISPLKQDIFAADGLNASQAGEPGSLSLVSSIEDLARAGNSILSSDLLPSAVTRRWLRPNVDTSNLVNGVGRPWEVYRYADSAISPVQDILTKGGTIAQYASYFGLTTDLDAGFAILAHDSSVEDRKLDLNVYADIVSDSLAYLSAIAVKETAQRYAGSYKGASKDTIAVLNVTDNGPGLEVHKLVVDGVNYKASVSNTLGIKLQDLDFRLYPTNVKSQSKQQFVAVFQDKSAPADMGTPTCITWQEVGAGTGDDYNFWFVVDEHENVTEVELSGVRRRLSKVQQK